MASLEIDLVKESCDDSDGNDGSIKPLVIPITMSVPLSDDLVVPLTGLNAALSLFETHWHDGWEILVKVLDKSGNVLSTAEIDPDRLDRSREKTIILHIDSTKACGSDVDVDSDHRYCDGDDDDHDHDGDRDRDRDRDRDHDHDWDHDHDGHHHHHHHCHHHHHDHDDDDHDGHHGDD